MSVLCRATPVMHGCYNRKDCRGVEGWRWGGGGEGWGGGGPFNAPVEGRGCFQTGIALWGYRMGLDYYVLKMGTWPSRNLT